MRQATLTRSLSGEMTSKQPQEWPKESNKQRPRQRVVQAGRRGHLRFPVRPTGLSWAWYVPGTERRPEWLKASKREQWKYGRQGKRIDRSQIL